ncbi:hypothetical protein OPV22_000199 [Ensete ventricosum]|uniref:Uncharacterized protein n=1 Tax=Ensete ventricosum TaxID=4639 RepID=A0AAV8QA18_ENSVE|nr:hypothetical protein OPV22_000199 [Ensete ventricosum]
MPLPTIFKNPTQLFQQHPQWLTIFTLRFPSFLPPTASKKSTRVWILAVPEMKIYGSLVGWHVGDRLSDSVRRRRRCLD